MTVSCSWTDSYKVCSEVQEYYAQFTLASSSGSTSGSSLAHSTAGWQLAARIKSELDPKRYARAAACYLEFPRRKVQISRSMERVIIWSDESLTSIFRDILVCWIRNSYIQGRQWAKMQDKASMLFILILVIVAPVSHWYQFFGSISSNTATCLLQFRKYILEGREVIKTVHRRETLIVRPKHSQRWLDSACNMKKEEWCLAPWNAESEIE